jgi:hypothetical protein
MSGPVDDTATSRTAEPPANPVDGPEARLRYVPNPKHKEPWQRGRRGSVCPETISEEEAQQLLAGSELIGQKRYAVHEGRAYCAQDDGIGGWHGYPVGWKEVPSRLRTRWEKREKRVKKRDIDRYWEG